MRIIAIDPGERVGWATATYSAAEGGSLTLDTHGISQLKPFAIKLGEVINDYDLLIYEKFILFGGDRGKSQVGTELPTAQLVGMIRYLCWANEVEMKGQTVTVKKTADKTAEGQFKELIEGETKHHDDGHDVDAIRHLWYWFWKKKVTNGK